MVGVSKSVEVEILRADKALRDAKESLERVLKWLKSGVIVLDSNAQRRLARFVEEYERIERRGFYQPDEERLRDIERWSREVLEYLKLLARLDGRQRTIL